MDSLSQIVLGAAVGEAVLGKKIGNRAMVIGAIGGTIPDLDVIANLFLSPMQAMDFHRGISHSITFAVLAPLLFGSISHFFYRKQLHTSKAYRIILSLILISSLGLVLGAAGYAAFTTQTWWAMGITIALFLIFGIILLKYIRSEKEEYEKIPFWKWYSFFFWTFITHILLDVFTTYGTQVFMPFSNYRATFGSVSVVDPIYTLPFLLFLFIAAFFSRTSKIRTFLNWTGIILSSGYLFYTVFTKTFMNQIFEDSYQAKNIEYNRYITTPSLFNSILWSSTAETDTSFVIGTYSKFDPSKWVQQFKEIPKNHHLIAGHEEDEHIVILKRFTNNFYTIKQDSVTQDLTFIDLRWGILSSIAKIPEENNFPIIFHLKKENGKMIALEHREPPSAITREMLESYWDRIMGRWQ